MNDEKSKRAYESKTDAYRVFKKMLESGNPPDDWEKLLEQVKDLEWLELVDYYKQKFT